MKITICGSSTFCNEMIEYRNKLNQMEHEAIIHPSYEEFVAGKRPRLIRRIEKDCVTIKKQYDFIRWYYNAIVDSDAIFVLNLDKNNVKNYVGGNTLMEMGFAHVHRKRIFLLNPVPEVAYKDEILAMVTDVLNGDLDRIK